MSNHAVVLPLLATILAVGLLALNPSMIGNAQAQMYDSQYDSQYGYDNSYYKDDNRYGYDNSYYKDDNRYGYDHKEQKSSNVNVQKIKCVNSNTNINGIDITEVPTDDLATAEAANEGTDAAGAQNGNGWGDKINFDRNLVNICINLNFNNQERTPLIEDLLG